MPARERARAIREHSVTTKGGACWNRREEGGGGELGGVGGEEGGVSSSQPRAQIRPASEDSTFTRLKTLRHSHRRE